MAAKGYTNPIGAGVNRVALKSEVQPHWCERLYAAHAAELLLYGRALGLSHCEAEDVLQDTFVNLMRLRSVPERPHHYCLRSYRNGVMNYRRSFWRRLRRELESTRWFEPSEGETVQEREAMRALAGLPAEQREVIVLKIWHGRTLEEIGELLELSPNTVAGRYRYGMQKLRTTLRGTDYERVEPSREPIEVLEIARTVGPN